MRPPRACSIAAAFLAALLLVAGPAAAFRSAGKGATPHEEATGDAGPAGWPANAVEALREAVVAADVQDFSKDDEGRLVATPVFRPWHHCDREPPGNDSAAFAATVAYVQEQRGLATQLSLLDPPAAIRALGRALHALQDCFAHTNVVDLPPGAQAQLRDALLTGNGSAPPGLLVAGARPDSKEMGNPPGDPWPHDAHNRDAPDSSPDAEATLPDGRTRHAAALALATETTREFLRAFDAGLDAHGREALLAVDDDAGEADAASGGARGLPLPAVGLVAALALALVLARRQR